MKFDGVNNQTHEKTIHKTVLVHWSQQRAWHGDEVTLSVRTTLVKDGAAAKLKIHPADASDELGAVSDTISGSKLDHKYKIEWQGKPYGDHRDFVFEATIGGKLGSPPSPDLRVDLVPPLFSA